MNQQIENRRDFLKRASLAALAFPLLINCKSDTLAQKSGENALDLIKKNALGLEGPGEWSGAKDAPANVSWKAVMAKETDEGEPMIISGTVFEKDGKTAAPNILIYLYHTDMYGIYGRKVDAHRHGKFRGWMLTDEKGRYEFRSIKPASYPNTTFAAHVHMTVTGKSFREDWIDSILFEGDKFLTQQERNQAGKKGGFKPIVKLEKGADGILRATRDIQLMS